MDIQDPNGEGGPGPSAGTLNDQTGPFYRLIGPAPDGSGRMIYANTQTGAYFTNSQMGRDGAGNSIPQGAWEPYSGPQPGTSTTQPWSGQPGGPAPAAAPGPSGAPGGGAPSGDGLVSPFPGQFTAPPQVNLGGPAGIPYIPQTPQFQAPTLGTPPPFSYANWKAPSVDEALNDPGYQFRVSQGRDQLQNWAAARGTLNDSGTAKALEDYGQNSASQEYSNIWNRDFSAWNTGYGNALGAYNTNYNTQYSQPYQAAYAGWNAGTVQPGMQGYSTQASAGQHQNDMNYSNAWNQYLQNYLMFRNRQLDTVNATTALA